VSDRLAGLAAEAIDQALAASAEADGLPDYYRDCVRPLLRLPLAQWPRCCGGGCEPCSEALRRVAAATLARLGRSVVERSENG
jgi:hypothetical protein